MALQPNLDSQKALQSANKGGGAYNSLIVINSASAALLAFLYFSASVQQGVDSGFAYLPFIFFAPVFLVLFVTLTILNEKKIRTRRKLGLERTRMMFAIRVTGLILIAIVLYGLSRVLYT